jgi:hypothetical protein
MTSARLRSLVFAAGISLIAGCLPTDMPAYVNDGKTIITMGMDASGKQMMLWTYDLQTKKATPHPPPEGQSVQFARMLGDQVWVQLGQPVGFQGEVTICMRFDPVRNEYLPEPPEMKDRDWLRGAIVASYEGKPCVLFRTRAQPAADGKLAYDILTFPELKKTATVFLNWVLAAGGFRWVTVSRKERKRNEKGNYEPFEFGQVEVFNQKGEKVLTVPDEETRKMGAGGGRFDYVRINEEEKILLLVNGEQGYYLFGLFDTNNGKFLWGGHSDNPATGHPLVKRNEVWCLEEKELHENNGIRLVRNTPGEKANESKRETVLTLADVGVSQYARSPDGSHFVVQAETKAEGTPSRLLFIPIKEKVTEQEVTVVELVETKAATK